MRTDSMSPGISVRAVSFYIRGGVLIFFGLFMMIFLTSQGIIVLAGIVLGIFFVLLGAIFVYVAYTYPPPVPAPHRIPPPCSKCRSILYWQETKGKYHCLKCREDRYPETENTSSQVLEPGEVDILGRILE
jgi:hypothetical protein